MKIYGTLSAIGIMHRHMFSNSAERAVTSVMKSVDKVRKDDMSWRVVKEDTLIKCPLFLMSPLDMESQAERGLLKRHCGSTGKLQVQELLWSSL